MGLGRRESIGDGTGRDAPARRLRLDAYGAVLKALQPRNRALQTMAERGRGLVLVGAARLDLALEHLLKAVLAPSAPPDAKLFTPDRFLRGGAGRRRAAAALTPLP